MGRNVWERKILGTDQLYWGTFEQTIVLLTYESSVLHCFVYDIVDIALGRDDTNVGWIG